MLPRLLRSPGLKRSLSLEARHLGEAADTTEKVTDGAEAALQDLTCASV